MNPTLEPLTPKLQDLTLSERPQERLERHGAKALSDTELLAMLLRSGGKGNNVLSIASQLLNEAGSLSKLIGWNDAQFSKIKGIGRVKALQLVTVVEICRRVLASGKRTDPICDSPEIVFELMRPQAMGLEVEKFWTLCLNRKNRLIRLCEITSGTASNSLVHPREVFKEAIHNGASAIICAHNHPSGDPTPSVSDIQITRKLKDASKILSIDLIDHIVLGQKEADPLGSGFYSFQNAGLL